MLYCFLDTNIFLEFTTFDEIDWNKELGVNEALLVVPQTVIQQLDKHKYDPRSNRRQDRSRMILNKIEALSDLEDSLVRKGVYLRILQANPNPQWLLEHNYDPDDSDDRIVGAVEFFIEQNPELSVVLLTDDTGPRLKAKTRRIKAIAPREELRLENEPDPLQRETNQLRREPGSVDI